MRKWFDISLNENQTKTEEEIKKGKAKKRPNCVVTRDWFPLCLDERIAFLDREIESIEVEIIGIARCQIQKFPSEDGHTSKGYEDVTVSKTDKLPPLGYTVCDLCVRQAPYKAVIGKFYKLYNHLCGIKEAKRTIHQRRLRKICLKYIHEVEHTMNRVLGKHLYCASCGILLGNGHEVNYVDQGRGLVCSVCPKNWWDWFQPRANQQAKERWLKPPVY